MNKEIKEILDYMQEYIKPFNHDSEPMLNSEDIKILLDYITNLQKKLDFMIDRNDEKQDRIDKALEYIGSGKVKVMEYIDDFNTPIHTNWKLIEILKGDE